MTCNGASGWTTCLFRVTWATPRMEASVRTIGTPPARGTRAQHQKQHQRQPAGGGPPSPRSRSAVPSRAGDQDQLLAAGSSSLPPRPAPPPAPIRTLPRRSGAKPILQTRAPPGWMYSSVRQASSGRGCETPGGNDNRPEDGRKGVREDARGSVPGASYARHRRPAPADASGNRSSTALPRLFSLLRSVSSATGWTPGHAFSHENLEDASPNLRQ
jgi:hypothetical protein